MGAIAAELPPSVPVLTLATAAEVVLRERGYTIIGRGTSADVVELAAEGASTGAVPRVLVRVANTPGGSLIVIKCGLLGDETTSRILLEAVLAKLGR